MTKEIIIDVSDCPHKSDDDCMDVPICNEYGDLIGYQSCEAQTLCPYRSQKKIERLEQENEKLKEENKELKKQLEFSRTHKMVLDAERIKCKQALEEIREISKQCMTKDLCSIDCDYADRCYIEDEEVPAYDICKHIIEKINEVLK